MTLVAGLIFAAMELVAIVVLSVSAAAAPDEEECGYMWDIDSD